MFTNPIGIKLLKVPVKSHVEIAEIPSFHLIPSSVHTTNMIADVRVLDLEFVPGDVAYRDAKINLLSSVLRPVTDRKSVDPTFLYGPSGTGKTCIAQYTLDKLHESGIDFNTQYVNCRS